MITKSRKEAIFNNLCSNASVCRKRNKILSCAICKFYSTCETQRKINKYLQNKNK
jgi:hypothetical protein